jgi:hypothetical protein
MELEKMNETKKSKLKISASCGNSGKSHHKSAKKSSKFLMETEFENNDESIKIRPHHVRREKTTSGLSKLNR